MLASKPAGTGTGANPPYNLAAATTRMLWVCAFATARVTVASTARSLELWSHLLRARSGLADHGAVAAQSAANDDGPPASTAAAGVAEGAAPAATPPAQPPFASYRSSGGHATAQVTVSD